MKKIYHLLLLCVLSLYTSIMAQISPIAINGTRVGIGTTVPHETLHVLGNIKGSKFIGDGSGLTNIPGTTQWAQNQYNVISYWGRVGIGITNPTYRFEVAEPSRFSGTIHVAETAHLTLPYMFPGIRIMPRNVATEKNQNLNSSLSIGSGYFNNNSPGEDSFVIYNRRTGDQSKLYNIEFITSDSRGNRNVMRYDASYNRFILSGALGFGTTSTATGFSLENIDTFLYRKRANVLETNGGLIVGDTVTANFFVGNGSRLTNLPVASSQWKTVTQNHIIFPSGNVGINTATAPYTLTVGGIIGASDIITFTSTWADYVFEKNYPLLPLAELEAYIRTHGHLPNIPSADVIKKEGVSTAKIQASLLEKIEELTLYILDLQKQIDDLKSRH